MLSDHGLVALRKAATLAHAVPSIRLRISGDDRVLLAVRPASSEFEPGGDGIDHDELGSARVLTPCAFRAAVARAHDLHATGQQLAFCGLGDGSDPTIEVGLRRGDDTLPGGIYRVRLADQYVHLFATTLDIERCRQVATDMGVDAELLDSSRGPALIGFHHDEATGVTLVHTACALGDLDAAASDRELIEGLVANYGVDELLSALSMSSSTAG